MVSQVEAASVCSLVIGSSFPRSAELQSSGVDSQWLAWSGVVGSVQVD